MTFRWWVKSLLLMLIGIPLLAQGVGFVFFILYEIIPDKSGLAGSAIVTLVPYALGGVTMFASGWLWARITPAKEYKALHQSLLLLPAALLLLAWVVTMQSAGLSFSSLCEHGCGFFSAVSWPWGGVLFVAGINGQYWDMVIVPVGAQVCFALGYFWRNRHVPDSRVNLRVRHTVAFITLVLILLAGWQAKMRADKYASADDRRSIGEHLETYRYQPDVADSKLTALRGDPPFTFADKHPRLDGATAAYPLYASAFFALNTFADDMPRYKIRDCCLRVSRTPTAYQNILADNADIIFVAQPSEGQKKRAQEANVKLTYTPFAHEAFVFITHADNPVNTLTQRQVRDIFSGKITRWDEVGGNKQEIEVWQRPEDSGSQSTMLAKVMKETAMLPPKETEVAAGMGGVIRKVADYQNSKGAIGYTFRYYASKMNPDAGIKLLAIDDIKPTKESIGDGSYPFTVDIYMVTRENPTPETQKLVAWFLGPQGQALVEDVGYVPLHSTQE